MFWLGDAFTMARSEREGRFKEQGHQYYVYLERAGRARADVFAAAFAWIGRRIRSGARTVRAALIVLSRTYRRARRMGASIRDLNALSDHALKDIGLHRSQIPSVAAALANGRRPQRRVRSARIERGPRTQASGRPAWEAPRSDWREAA